MQIIKITKERSSQLREKPGLTSSRELVSPNL